MNRWTPGNRITLLENGEAFFPRVFDCIGAAKKKVVVETFILFEDKVGLALHAALLQAAAQGAEVDLTVDGFGSANLSEAFIAALTQAGVRVHVFDPGPRVWGWRTNVFRRMHRKIVVVDGERAFVGGINYSADHLSDYGPQAKQDYAVEIEGPLVGLIEDFAQRALAAGQRNAGDTWMQRLRHFAASLRPRRLGGPAASTGLHTGGQAKPHPDDAPLPEPAAHGAPALFVTRDNRKHTNDIERHYRIAIRSARERVIIANAYFFPGYRLLHEMRKASRRGVRVQLILQGHPDMPIVKTAATMLYPHLLRSGVEVYEYTERPLHGKVAVSDGLWATVGSSNLDPLSLSLNLEANVVVKDPVFNAALADKLQGLIARKCQRVDAADYRRSTPWQTVRNFCVFHLVRHYPAWAGWLPAHAPVLALAQVHREAREALETRPVRAGREAPVRGGADEVRHADPA
jgi:cardiolipin synthase A/B